MDYIKSIIFLISFLIYVYNIGCVICGEKSHDAKKLIVGYITHSAFIGIVGIIVQLFKLSWITFMICHLAIIIVLLLISVIRIINNDKVNIKNLIKAHFKNMWFIYVLACIMLVFSLFNVNLQLLNNHLDDGLYLLRIAQLPYLDAPFATNVSSGFAANSSASISSFSYVFNVFDLEASVYNYLFNLEASVFARFALNWLNYFLFATSMLWLVAEIMKNTKISKINYQYMTVVILLLCYYPQWLNYVYSLPDDWQINTAMWYGSSVVRCMGIFFYLNILLSEKDIKRLVLYYILTSITLFTKSSIALPLIVVSFLIYLGYFIYIEHRKYFKYYILLYVAICLICCAIIGIPSFSWQIESDAILTKEGIRSLYIQGMSLILTNIKFPILICSLLVIIVSFFQKENELIKKWSILFVSIFILLIVPIFNYPVIVCSMYSHVIRRMFTLSIYTMILTASIYVIAFLYRYIRKKHLQACLSLGICLCLVSAALLNYKISGYSVKGTISYISQNSKLMPTDTIELSNSLNSISKNTDKEIYVLCPDVVFYPEGMHAVAVVLKMNAPDIKIVSALPRFRESDEKYDDFTEIEQLQYRDFSTNPDTKEIENVKVLLEKFNEINCLVTTYELDKKTNKELDITLSSVNQNSLSYYIYTIN